MIVKNSDSGNASLRGDNYKVRICYLGTYDKQRPRNRNIISGFKENNIDVVECHYSPWGEIEDKGTLRGPFRRLLILVRFLIAYPYLAFRYLLTGTHDAVIVGYLGHLDMFLARPLASLRRKHVIFDAFISLYDTVVNDRKLSRPDGFIGRLCFFIDKTACRMADIVLLDTNAHIEYFVKTFNIPGEKFRRVFVGADESQFYPISQCHPPSASQPFRVLFYGQFIPLHGIEYIVRAAKLLEQDSVEFTIIGKGQEYNKIRKLSDDLGIKNIRWIDWVESHKLVHYINEADVVLGIFGDSEKARRVIPNKAFQTIACKRPLITGDSPAARELFQDGENVLLCQMGNPDAIAASILRLRDNEDFRLKVAINGYNTFLSTCNINAIGKEVKILVEEEWFGKD